jgi:hypothetical protein
MKDIYKPINRFPMVYKLQAQKAIDYAIRDAIRTTADAFVMGSILAVIETFGCGTGKNATKIHEYVAALQEIIDTNADFYDDAVAEGLKNKLHNYGIEYDLRGG